MKNKMVTVTDQVLLFAALFLCAGAWFFLLLGFLAFADEGTGENHGRDGADARGDVALRQGPSDDAGEDAEADDEHVFHSGISNLSVRQIYVFLPRRMDVVRRLPGAVAGRRHPG